MDDVPFSLPRPIRPHRVRVSYDAGETWAPEEYILGEGENYPGNIAMPDGMLMTICPYRDCGPIHAFALEATTGKWLRRGIE